MSELFMALLSIPGWIKSYVATKVGRAGCKMGALRVPPRSQPTVYM